MTRNTASLMGASRRACSSEDAGSFREQGDVRLRGLIPVDPENA
jgi:hypothetical protein